MEVRAAPPPLRWAETRSEQPLAGPLRLRQARQAAGSSPNRCQGPRAGRDCCRRAKFHSWALAVRRRLPGLLASGQPVWGLAVANEDVANNATSCPQGVEKRQPPQSGGLCPNVRHLATTKRRTYDFDANILAHASRGRLRGENFHGMSRPLLRLKGARRAEASLRVRFNSGSTTVGGQPLESLGTLGKSEPTAHSTRRGLGP